MNGGGLVFIISGISYQNINISTSILDNNNLEVQDIRVTWRGKPLNILTLYQPPDLKGLPNELQELLTAAQDDGQAANMLGKYHQNVSRMNFTCKGRDVKIRASNMVHGCRSSSQDGTSIYNKDFTIQELEKAISETNINKSHGPGGIHGQMIYNLDQRGRQKFLVIINESWRTGQLPRDWWRAIVIPIRNPSKEANSPENF
ncbi:RNase H domain-containing protein [Nephila pilipes]|uniref:RNase H domain-containing protein n=1 Tax=Nephila pilipes TaxID=299642 RepID=A0A8X6TXJ4_NEPPI|nr:RNase H domain-containing protein [Nephila pilipes]